MPRQGGHGRTCTVCAHPDRAMAEAAILAGYPPLRELGKIYRLSKTAILRHKARHMAAATPAPPVAGGGGDATVIDGAAGVAPAELLARLEGVCTQLRRLGRKAERSGDLRGAVAACAAHATQLMGLFKVYAEHERQRAASALRNSGFERAWALASAMSAKQLGDIVAEARLRERALPAGAEPEAEPPVA